MRLARSKQVSASSLSVICLFTILLWPGSVLSVTARAAEKPDSEQLAQYQQEVTELTSSISDKQTRQRLIAIDDELATSEVPLASGLRGTILNLLAESEDEASLEYIRGVFETQSEFRDEAAMAISRHAIKRPTDLQDWRFLIRSLTVTEGEQTVSVMKALLRYRQRATNAHWIKRVILQGAKLDADGQRVAVDLLIHWTGLFQEQPELAKQANLQTFSDYYEQKWPNEQPPLWPVEAETTRWNQAALNELLTNADWRVDRLEAGKKAYIKASCAKCHVKGEIGLPYGPELSSITGLRQRKELVEAILFPSLEIHEDYPSVTVVTVEGKILTGLMSAGTDDRIKLVDLEGKSTEVERSAIEEIRPASLSNMPVGGLEILNEAEILALFAFLQHLENPTKPFHTNNP